MKKTFNCMQEKEASAMLKESGLKSTPQRMAVVHVLHSSTKYLSINEILENVKMYLPKTGLATIYRTLETFVRLGLVRRVHFPDGCDSYTLSTEQHSHQMVCTECNAVFSFSDCPIDDNEFLIGINNGLKVKNHFIQLFGECEDCQH